MNSIELLGIVVKYNSSCEFNPCFKDYFEQDYTQEEKEKWLKYHENEKQSFKSLCEKLNVEWCHDND